MGAAARWLCDSAQQKGSEEECGLRMLIRAAQQLFVPGGGANVNRMYVYAGLSGKMQRGRAFTSQVGICDADQRCKLDVCVCQFGLVLKPGLATEQRPLRIHPI